MSFTFVITYVLSFLSIPTYKADKQTQITATILVTIKLTQIFEILQKHISGIIEDVKETLKTGQITCLKKLLIESVIIDLVNTNLIKINDNCIAMLTNIVLNGDAPSFNTKYDNGKFINKHTEAIIW